MADEYEGGRGRVGSVGHVQRLMILPDRCRVNASTTDMDERGIVIQNQDFEKRDCKVSINIPPTLAIIVLQVHFLFSI